MAVQDLGAITRGLVEPLMGTEITAVTRTTLPDGITPLTDADVDDIKVWKKGGIYKEQPWIGWVWVDAYGAKGDAIFDPSAPITTPITAGTDDTLAFQKALTYIGKRKGKILVSPDKKYIATNLQPRRNVTIECPSGGLYRFGGPNATNDASAWIINKSGASTPLFNLLEPAWTLRNLLIYGNQNSVDAMYIDNGFEAQMDNVRIANNAGAGLRGVGLYNIYFNKVFVDNCGSVSGYAVYLNSNPPRTINTLNWTGLTIERCQNGALKLGEGTNAFKGYAEMLFFYGLHVESPSDNGGVPNVDALVSFENFRNCTLVAPFIYGGPGYLLEHNQSEPTSIGLFGGLRIEGGTILGRNFETGFQPTHLIHLINGDGFSMSGTVLDNCNQEMVVVESTYGPNVWLNWDILKKRGGNLVLDNRTNPNPYRLEGNALFIKDVTIRGHLKSKDTTTNVTIALLPAAGTAPPTPLLIDCNDTKGKVLWGTGTVPAAGAQFTVTYETPYLTIPEVFITCGNRNTALLDIYRAYDQNGFTLYFTGTPAASTTQTTYQISYFVIE